MEKDLKQTAINNVLASVIFDARKKWGIVRWIKQTPLAEERLQKIADTFEKESEFLTGFANLSEEQKLVKISDFVLSLDQDLYREVFSKIKIAEDKSRRAENLDDILNELENV